MPGIVVRGYASYYFLPVMRKHLLWYTKGLEGFHHFRQVVGTLPDRDIMQSELDKYFQSLACIQS
jgi:tRNA-dihydrouridine synthase